ncbi:hypothetical protein [Pseudocitrobacter sp. 73]
MTPSSQSAYLRLALSFGLAVIYIKNKGEVYDIDNMHVNTPENHINTHSK